MDDKPLPTAKEAAERRAEEILAREPSSTRAGKQPLSRPPFSWELDADDVPGAPDPVGAVAKVCREVLTPIPLPILLPRTSGFALVCNGAIISPLFVWKFLILPITIPLAMLVRLSAIFRLLVAIVVVLPSYAIHFPLAKVLMGTSWLWHHAFILRPVLAFILRLLLAVVSVPVAILDGAIVMFVQQAVGESDPDALLWARVPAVLWPHGWLLSFLSARAAAYPSETDHLIS